MDIRDSLFTTIYQLMQKNSDIVFMTSDADSFVMRDIAKDFPKRFINIGVSEQAAIDVCAGLALSGKFVFLYALAPFITGRCYEHIKSVICGMKLQVCIIGAGAGLSFSKDGPTHHSINDIALMSTLPEISIYNPCDSYSARESVRQSYLYKVPSYIRLDKGKFPSIRITGKAIDIVKPLKNINVVTTGFMTSVCLSAFPNYGIVDVMIIKPFDYGSFNSIVSLSDKLIVVEENCFTGALGSIVYEYVRNIPVARIALPDEQLFEYGTREYLHKIYGIDKETLNRSAIWTSNLQ